MAYTRRQVKDHETIMNKDLYDNLQDGIDSLIGTTKSIEEVITSIPETVHASNAGFAEIGEWSDGNTNNEDRLCYFVSVSKTERGITMTKARSDSDVRGVTIEKPAFVANAEADKFDTDGNLLPRFNYVSFAGFATVIDNGTCTVKERCVSDDNGCAVPSTNNMGYQVIERVDDTHVLILVEPNADMFSRIKTDISALESDVSLLNQAIDDTDNRLSDKLESELDTQLAGANAPEYPELATKESVKRIEDNIDCMVIPDTTLGYHRYDDYMYIDDSSAAYPYYYINPSKVDKVGYTSFKLLLKPGKSYNFKIYIDKADMDTFTAHFNKAELHPKGSTEPESIELIKKIGKNYSDSCYVYDDYITFYCSLTNCDYYGLLYISCKTDRLADSYAYYGVSTGGNDDDGVGIPYALSRIGKMLWHTNFALEDLEKNKLSRADLKGYALKTDIPSEPSDIGAEPSGTTEAHNTNIESHNDIRLLISSSYNELKEDLVKVDSNYTQLEITLLNGYANVDGTYADSYYRVEQPIVAGEKYKIRSHNGANVRCYVIKDKNGIVTRVADGDSWGTTHNYDFELTINENEDEGLLIVSTLEASIIGLQKLVFEKSFNSNFINDNSLDGCKLIDESVDINKIKYVSDLLIDKYENIDGLEFNVGFMENSGNLSTYSDCNYVELDVKEGEKYFIRANYGYNVPLFVVKSSTSVIYAYPLYSGTNIGKVYYTIPKSATKLYVNTYLPSNNIIVMKANGLNYKSNLTDKKAIFFGDSITANNGSWADASTIMVKNRMSGENYGVGGSTYTVKSNSDESSCIYLRVKKVRENGNENDSDYIILEGGVNDAFQSLPLGTISDNFTSECDTGTFAGAFESTIKYVLSNWIGAKVGFIANYKILNLSNLGDYLDMAKNICKKYSVPVLDLYNESGFCVDLSEVKNEFSADGTHINKSGYNKLINDKVEAWMKTL